MRDSTGLQTLIEDVLNCNRMSHVGCFATNVAAQELEQCDASALSAIEDTIRKRVVADSDAAIDHNELLRKHHGLLNLWGSYFHIGKDGDVACMVRFMRSLNGPVLATGILAMKQVWHNKGSDITLPKPLYEFIHEIAEDRAGNAADIAKHQLDLVWQSKT